MRTHSGNGVHQEMDRRAIDCFDQALVDAELAADDRLRQALHDYFAWAISNVNRFHESADDVPGGLRYSPLVIGWTRWLLAYICIYADGLKLGAPPRSPRPATSTPIPA